MGSSSSLIFCSWYVAIIVISVPSEGNYVRTPNAKHGDLAQFRVFSQNILANSWISQNGVTEERMQDLIWETRMSRILVELQSRNPDIITLQEVEQDAFNNDL